MSKMSRIGYGLNVSPAAYINAETGELTSIPPRAELALHEYRPTADGGLEHFIDGHLRAIVAAADRKDYARVWPESAAGQVVSSSSKPKGEELAERGAAAARADDDESDDDPPLKRPAPAKKKKGKR